MKQQRSNAYPELHQRSRTSPGKRSRKARSRVRSTARIPQFPTDATPLDPSLHLNVSDLSVAPSAPILKKTQDSNGEALCSHQPLAGDPDSEALVSNYHTPEVDGYIGDGELARLLSRELRKES